eukprot:1379572-Amphidinium_carterae.2
MASGYGQPGKGKYGANHGSRPQNWTSSNTSRSGFRSYGSASSGSGDQWSMEHGWYSMDPWTAATAWTNHYSMPQQNQWTMTPGWSTLDPLAVMQGAMNSGPDNQWRMTTGSTASGSGDQWSMRAWTSQDSTRSWSAETTANRENGTSGMQEMPSCKNQKSSESCKTSLATSPKKPTDDAWKNVALDPPGVPYPDPRGMKSR